MKTKSGKHNKKHSHKNKDKHKSSKTIRKEVQEQKQKYRPKTSHQSEPLEEKLKQSKFRFLNEQLYTTNSDQAISLFKDLDSENFKDYHDGYRQQVNKWPKNPLDIFIQELSKQKYDDSSIADFGCGEGKLELAVRQARESRSSECGSVYSFDAGKLEGE